MRESECEEERHWVRENEDECVRNQTSSVEERVENEGKTRE